MERIERALEVVGLEKEHRKVFSAFSLGMKQRLSIAAAIMHEPELLILDEPINGLDPIGIQEIRNFLRTVNREKGTTIFLSSHVLSEVEQVADIIGIMHNGNLIEETDIAQLRKRNRPYLEFEVSDVSAAAKLLVDVFGTREYTAGENQTLRLYDRLDRGGEINRCFVEHGLVVTGMIVSKEKLEDYFSGLIGGGSVG